jgi:hypothetical protein
MVPDKYNILYPIMLVGMLAYSDVVTVEVACITPWPLVHMFPFVTLNIIYKSLI